MCVAHLEGEAGRGQLREQGLAVPAHPVRLCLVPPERDQLQRRLRPRLGVHRALVDEIALPRMGFDQNQWGLTSISGV